MTQSTFESIGAVLQQQFNVEPDRISPQTTLPELGLDSLALMEFVFSIEDHFSLRIPEDRLDPRKAGLTLADVCAALEEALGQRSLAVPVA
jgi:acyl carrier protein